MKKRIWLLFLSLFCLTACTTFETTEKTTEENTISDTETASQQEGTVYNKSFGTYTVANGWIESETFSTEDKFFYIAETDQQQTRPNNISINMGSNFYSLDDHVSFRKAILNQLAAQLPQDAVLNGSGSYTDNDYVLYTFTFTITDKENSLIATQYYIVGDYIYIMVYESVYDESNKEETDMVAKTIVDTFLWAE